MKLNKIAEAIRLAKCALFKLVAHDAGDAELKRVAVSALNDAEKLLPEAINAIKNAIAIFETDGRYAGESAAVARLKNILLKIEHKEKSQ